MIVIVIGSITILLNSLRHISLPIRLWFRWDQRFMPQNHLRSRWWFPFHLVSFNDHLILFFVKFFLNIGGFSFGHSGSKHIMLIRVQNFEFFIGFSNLVMGFLFEVDHIDRIYVHVDDLITLVIHILVVLLSLWFSFQVLFLADFGRLAELLLAEIEQNHHP